VPLQDAPRDAEIFEPVKAPLFPSDPSSQPPIDLVITLGGDGTILHASSLFSHGPVPPVLSFSLGTLGFLLPFNIDSMEEVLKDVISGKVSILPRMRLSCRVRPKGWDDLTGEENVAATSRWEVMNEVSLHRGSSPHLVTADAYVDDQHLTEAILDGLIVSTPTGSTAYSLSSGGPIVHPAVQVMLLTPVSPMSLSFRPLVLPSWSKIRIEINTKSRSPAYVSMDGREAGTLQPGDSVLVEASPWPIPCINVDRVRHSHDTTGDQSKGEFLGHDTWVRDINMLLGFNVSFKANTGR